MASTFSRDGIRIAYEAHGEGRPSLVFVHGWSCDRTDWAEQLPVFARDFRVVAIDLGGHGESSAGREHWTIAAFGDDVAAVVEDLGLEQVILIGHSMGGDVVVEAARRMREQVAGLVWVDTYSKLGEPRAPEALQAFVAPFRDDFVARTRAFVRGMFVPGTESLAERIAERMSARPPEIAVPAMLAAMSYEREIPAALAELCLPAVAINPDQRPTDVDSLAGHGIRTMLLSGLGHFPMLEAPERFNAALRDAIESFREGAAAHARST